MRLTPSDHKSELRRELLARRAALDPADAARLSAAVHRRLRELPAWATAREVLAYAAFRNEVATADLLDELWARGSRVLLPRCAAAPGELEFACVGCAAELAPGRHAIPEPDPAACRPLAAFAPDLVLVPGVGFARDGVRLGFGGGYYDRMLGDPALARALLVGLAYDFQVLDALPAEPWDRPVDVIVTPEHLYTVAAMSEVKP